MERPSLTSIKNESGNDNSVKSKGKPQNIKVILRARPPLKSEFGKEIAVSCTENKKTVNIDTSTNIVQSTLDGAFDETACQLEIFQQIKSYIPDVIQGYNCTIFAYGQTGSGKTHTMFGADWENIMMRNQGGLVNNIQNTYIGDLDEDKNLSGLIPRTIHELFREIQKEENRAQNFAVYCSFLQIYNEKIFDLLTERSSNTALMIRENKMDGIYVDGLTEYCVSNFDECLLLMQRGEKNRFIRHTSNNVKSSRSHTIFQLTVESTCADASGKLQKAKLNLCDLAGSEKLNKGEDIANAHLKELKNINLSLTTLGKVIHNLSLAQKLPIPYRESKLTRLLQDSLGGNTRTCLIATLAPTLDFVDETLNTLKFAERAKHIVTEVKANKIEAVDAELITKLQKEIHYLKEILNIRRKGTSAINQVNQKLLILQEENARLRQSQFSIPEVEKLLHENRAIKFELQQLRYETNSQSDRFQEGDQNFDATGGLSTYSRKTQMPPLAKSIFEPRVGDILDTVHETEREKASPQRVSSSIHRRKSSKVLDYVLNDTTDTRIKNNSEGPASLRVGKLISVAFSAKNQENSNTSTRVLPLRVKGKSTDNLRKVNKPPQEYKIEFKTKEQMKSLRRLQDLDAWQKKLRGQEMGYDTTSKGRFSAAPSMSDITTTGSVQEKSVVVANKYPDFDKLYNPYKVRQEIERKYSSQPRSNLQMRNLKTTEEYSKFRNIEKNFF